VSAFSQDDVELVSRIASGDEQAAGRFDARFRPLLVRFLHGRIPPNDHEDLVQNTFLAAITQISQGRFQGTSSLGTWLIGILKHKIADYWDLNRQAQDPLPTDGSLRDASNRLPGALVFQPKFDVAIEVAQLLESLPKTHRSVLILNLREGWTTDQIATAMKLPPGTIGRMLWESKQMLRIKRSDLKKLTTRDDQ
jgi:RNA polymerase sigma factor (sigma-70 family)